jgi:hypothetical protein
MIINSAAKGAKHQPEDFASGKKVAGAYWQALKTIFMKITAPLMRLEPKTMKSNKSTIETVQ